MKVTWDQSNWKKNGHIQGPWDPLTVLKLVLLQAQKRISLYKYIGPKYISLNLAPKIAKIPLFGAVPGLKIYDRANLWFVLFCFVLQHSLSGAQGRRNLWFPCYRVIISFWHKKNFHNSWVTYHYEIFIIFSESHMSDVFCLKISAF
jgi:hypothetical protein